MQIVFTFFFGGGFAEDGSSSKIHRSVYVSSCPKASILPPACTYTWRTLDDRSRASTISFIPFLVILLLRKLIFSNVDGADRTDAKALHPSSVTLRVKRTGRRGNDFTADG